MNPDSFFPDEPEKSSDDQDASRDVADARAAEMLDQPATATTESSGSEAGRLSPEERERMFGLQFLHALLQHVHSPEPGAREARVQRVLAGLTEAAPTAELPQVAVQPVLAVSRRAPLSKTWAPRLVTAAALVIAVGLLWNSLGGTTAMAAVEQALEAASQLSDREYRVTAVRRGLLGRESQIHSTLYVRGAEYFALRHPSLILKGELWIGGSGAQTWLIPQAGPVFINDNPRLLHKWIGESNVSTPFLQVTTVLARLKDRYRLEFLTDETLPRLAGAEERSSFRQVHGVLEDKQAADQQQDVAQLPHKIDLWVDPHSGMVRRLILDWGRPDESAGLKQLTFELSSTEPLPEDWYQHGRHHADDRRVIRITPENP